MGGYLRVQAEYNMGGGGVPVGDSAGGELSQGRFTRDLTNDINYRVRGAISWDVRQQTEYGTLRTYIRFGAENTTPAATGGGTTFNPFWDRAFIQFAGFTVGRSQSFFDLFTYGGAYSYHNVRVSGDTGASGQNLWAYTAQFGNGFSGTLSLEDPATRKAGHGEPGGRRLPVDPERRDRQRQRLRRSTRSAFGFRVPDLVANLRVDQAWGFAGISAALHDASGAYYGRRRNVVEQRPSRRQVRLGVGWRRQVQPCRRRHDRLQRLLHRRRSGLLHQQQPSSQLYNSSTSVGLGWIADGVFNTGTRVELTKVWSALAGYEHIWSPNWRTSVVRRLCQRRLQRRRHQLHPAANSRARLRPAASPRSRRLTRRSRGSRYCRATAAAPTGASGKPAPGPSGTRSRSSISVWKCCTRNATPPSKAPPSCPRQRLAARRSRGHRRPERLVRDVPLAAQLLSMIA